MLARSAAPQRPANAPPAAIAVRPSLTFHYDETDRIVRTTGVGTWTIDIIEAHIRAIAPLLRKVREQDGKVLAMVDLTRAPLQSAEVTRRILDPNGPLCGAGDRVALIVQSSLLKVQMKRVDGNDDIAVFISPYAARTWLCAYRHG